MARYSASNGDPSEITDAGADGENDVEPLRSSDESGGSGDGAEREAQGVGEVRGDHDGVARADASVPNYRVIRGLWEVALWQQ